MREFTNQEMQFVEGVAAELRSRTGYAIELREMETTTKPGYFGACVSVPGSNVAPAFHVDEWIDMSQKGMSRGEIVDLVEGRIHDAERGLRNLPAFDFSREGVLQSVRYAIGSEDKHADIMGRVPYARIEGTDLFLYPVGEVQGIGTYSLQREQLDAVGITDDEVLDACQSRLDAEQAQVQPMGDMLSRMIGGDAGDYPNPGIVVITNDKSYDGAVMAARGDVLEQAREMLGCDEIMILPSSKHEILAIPAGTTEPREAEEMVRTINATQVAEQDVLSDHVYKFDGEKLQKIETAERTRSKSR